MKVLFLSTLLVFSSCSAPKVGQDREVSPKSSNKQKESNTPINERAKNCVCPKMWMPVCGADGKTYGNSCEAKCAEVDYTLGECLKYI